MTHQVAIPRIPPDDRVVLGEVIDRHARERPQTIFAHFEDGTEWSYGTLREKVRVMAAGLAALGVRKGDHVVVWLPNGPDCLTAWFAVNYLGAVYVPINLAYRGAMLSHALRLSEAKVAIIHAGLADRLSGLELAVLRDLVVLHGAPPEGLALSCHGRAALEGDPAILDDLDRKVRPWDTQSLMFTSGTTGPSKAVRSSYLHLWSVTDYPYRMFRPDDRFMINLPLFHVGGTVAVTAMITRGASVAVVESFKVDEFWQTMRRTGATVATLLGSMTPLLKAAPPSPDDANSPLRIGFMIPLVTDAKAFGTRFGCEIYTLYNMTEISTPIVSDLYPTALGSAGKLRPGVEARIVDENDIELPSGQVGELILRADCPWAFSDGYHLDPVASAKAWRNGWFHTGDAFRVDAEGNYFFADRMKDTIRRRGENISSFEVEAELGAYPDVADCAVVAARDAIGEEEVLGVIVPRDGAQIDMVALTEFLRQRLPHFMVPRYLRLVEAMPRTPTQKIQKNVLRDEGVTSDTWDREAAGLRIRRTTLSGT